MEARSDGPPSSPTGVEADLQVRLARQGTCTAADVPFTPAPRLNGFEYVGPRRYFVTICVQGRAPVFITRAAVDHVLTQFQITADNEGFAVIAYCFMPDHMHALVEGNRAAANFREFMRVFKQRSSFCWKQACGRELWQRSYF